VTASACRVLPLLAAVLAAQPAAASAAESVDYVRVCDVFGAGWLALPGTDTCLRVSGYVRLHGFAHSANTTTTNFTGAGGDTLWPVFSARAGPGLATHFYSGANAATQLRFAAPVADGAGGLAASPAQIVLPGPGWLRPRDPYRDTLDAGIRALLRFDTRSRTDRGILRGFLEFNADTPTNAIDGTNVQIRYGFVQFGPITVGLTDSFFNFDNGAYYGDVVGDRTARVMTFAYTAGFGDGISATVALEDPSVASGAGQGGIGGTTGAALFVTPGFSTAASRLPDLVGNVRVSQAWGTAQLSAVAGERRFTDGQCRIGAAPAGTCDFSATAWAVRGGLIVNLDGLGRGSHLHLQASYGAGANNFVFFGPGLGGLKTGGFWQTGRGPDGVTTDERGLERVTAWSGFVNLVHMLTPALRATLYGGYAALLDRGPLARLPGTQGLVLPDHTWQIGGGLQWSPAPRFDIGLELFLTRTRFTAFDVDPTTGPVGARASTADTAWGAIARVQRLF